MTTKKSPEYTAQQVKDIVDKAAAAQHVPKELAEAATQLESGGNPYAVGDHGTSFGLFQLHRGGELGNLTPEQAFNPWTNANVALHEFAHVMQVHPEVTDPGQIAALAQRPADPSGYASRIDVILGNIKAGSGMFGGAKGGSTKGWSPTLGDELRGTVKDTAGIVTSPLGFLEGLVQDFAKTSFWIRVGLVIVGVVFVFIGASKMVGGSVTLPSTPEAPEPAQAMTHAGERVTEGAA